MYLRPASRKSFTGAPPNGLQSPIRKRSKSHVKITRVVEHALPKKIPQGTACKACGIGHRKCTQTRNSVVRAPRPENGPCDRCLIRSNLFDNKQLELIFTGKGPEIVDLNINQVDCTFRASEVSKKTREKPKTPKVKVDTPPTPNSSLSSSYSEEEVPLSPETESPTCETSSSASQAQPFKVAVNEDANESETDEFDPNCFFDENYWSSN